MLHFLIVPFIGRHVALVFNRYIFFIMGDIATCKNLLNFHVVSYWSKWRLIDIVRELMSLERCPQSMRENLLKGKQGQVGK